VARAGAAGRQLVACPPVAVEIRPVSGRRELTQFIKLPFRLHAGTPWVPPLTMERRQFLSRSKNPYFKHADAELFLAWREGRPVGRITAQVDRRWDQYQGGSDGQFGFIDGEDDQEVFEALLGTAEGWVRDRGRERLIGPMDFTTNDECGLLIEGFDEAPMILEPWHPPYYQQRLESLGYAKLIDLLMWFLEMGRLKKGLEFHPAIHEAAQKVETEHGVTVRNMRRKDLESEITKFMEVYNAAWSDNFGFVPITEEEVAFQAKNLKPILDERWAFMAERDGEILGAALTLPDINQVLAKMNGRLLPLGWLRFLLDRRKVDQVRVFALGVKPEHQHLGIAASFYVKHLEATDPDGIMSGEQGWILETNEPMNRAMEGMGGKVVKKYRLYEKAL
jgi:ribosomal protein S18 acetylase RimI-like enzyme